MLFLSRRNEWLLFIFNIPQTPFYTDKRSIFANPETERFVVNKPKEDYSFWTKYKRFASTEILLYVIMVIGIILGIWIFS